MTTTTIMGRIFIAITTMSLFINTAFVVIPMSPDDVPRER
jgi:hypothetical protein